MIVVVNDHGVADGVIRKIGMPVVQVSVMLRIMRRPVLPWCWASPAWLPRRPQN